MPRGSKSTLADVAARAGVGPATVDRVLNERGNVSPDTARRVIEAARALGLRRLLPQTHRGLLRIEVILPRPELPLIDRLLTFLRSRRQSFGRSVVLLRKILPDERPRTVAEALVATTADAVITFAQDHPDVREAIAALKARGVPVVLVLTDLPGSERLAYAGTNHIKAGRTVGHLMARIAPGPGPVVILCNHHGFQSHSERIEGFRARLAEEGGRLQVVEVVEGFDDPERSFEGLRAALARHPDVVGVYNTGAATAASGAAIRASRLPRPPAFVAQEVTPDSRRLLAEGVLSFLLDQNVEDQALYAVAVLLHHFGFEEGNHVAVPYASPVTFTLLGPESLPP